MHAKLTEVRSEIQGTLAKLEEIPLAANLVEQARRAELYRILGLQQEMERNLVTAYAGLIQRLEEAAFEAGREAALNDGMLTSSSMELMQEAKEALYRELVK